ncbi:MAG: hypothetical protein KTR13_07905 [Saprospiraceae bacterium]|nr:hypothetical protein [Saprospiraceae bacterium]
MSRYNVKPGLSFKYPKNWEVKVIQQGQCYELLPAGKRRRMERYYFSFFVSREPYIAFSKKDMYDAFFYKTADKLCSEVGQSDKVEGFRINPFPNTFALDLRLGEYASFRVGEYGKSERGTEYAIHTWNRIFYHSTKNKTKIFSAHFTGLGQAKKVSETLKGDANNLISGLRYSSPNVSHWARHPFPKPWKDYQLNMRNNRNQPKVVDAPKPQPETSSVSIFSKPKPFERQLVRSHCYRCSGAGSISCYSCNGQGGHYDSKTKYDHYGDLVTETYWVSCYCGNGKNACLNCGGQGFTERYE